MSCLKCSLFYYKKDWAVQSVTISKSNSWQIRMRLLEGRNPAVWFSRWATNSLVRKRQVRFKWLFFFLFVVLAYLARGVFWVKRPREASQLILQPSVLQEALLAMPYLVHGGTETGIHSAVVPTTERVVIFESRARLVLWNELSYVGE